ncbi:MAG: hypothetical protein ACREC9_15905 [Methylocella sp.]
MMALRARADKIPGADLPRQMIGITAARTGAAQTERSPARISQRNDYRGRAWVTQAGAGARGIPDPGKGSYFPCFLFLLPRSTPTARPSTLVIPRKLHYARRGDREQPVET